MGRKRAKLIEFGPTASLLPGRCMARECGPRTPHGAGRALPSCRVAGTPGKVPPRPLMLLPASAMKAGCGGLRSHYDREGKVGKVLGKILTLPRSDPGAVVLQAGLLAVIAGYADTIGYLHFNAFAGLMTGNTIFLGIEVATGQFLRAGFHFIIIVAFLVGVIASRALLRHGMEPWHALIVTSLMLVVCSFVSKDFGAVLLALAMGTQNAAANRFNGVALNTVFITGNLQKLGEELVHWLWPQWRRAREATAPASTPWSGSAMPRARPRAPSPTRSWPAARPSRAGPAFRHAAAAAARAATPCLARQ